MTDVGPPPTEPGWTLSQRRALLLLLTIILSILCFRLIVNRAYVSDPQPALGAHASELLSRLDPNTADWQSLAAIPGMGEKKAKEIVGYRDHQRAIDPSRNAFNTADDLLQVRGIGVATKENLRPYLTFPGE